MRLAVIPARGGSKRIPKKNIKIFCGKPIIVWSIEAALKSGCFDRVIVSTDDEEIAAISKKNGAEVPFMRPAELSDDYSSSSSVITHAINWYQSKNVTYDATCCIYATAPFLNSEDILKSFNLLQLSGSDYIFSATSYPYPIQRALRINDSGKLQMFQPKAYISRSQDLEIAYHDAGQFYWGKSEAWLNNRPIFSENSSMYLLSRDRVQDIDTIDDWKVAELMFQLINRKE